MESDEEEWDDAFFAEVDALESKLLNKRKPWLLERVISGGQTGADRAGLEAAHALGLETGGTATPEFQTSRGKDLTLQSKFGLEALPEQSSIAQGYVRRSMKNVEDSDATLVFRTHASAGTEKTIGYCCTYTWGVWLKKEAFRAEGGVYVERCGMKPLCVVFNMDELSAVSIVRKFIRDRNVRVLNVAGHRDNGRGYQERVTTFLMKALVPK
jgi:hypothetical protein